MTNSEFRASAYQFLNWYKYRLQYRDAGLEVPAAPAPRIAPPGGYGHPYMVFRLEDMKAIFEG